MSDILVLVETEGTSISSTSGELIAAGRKLAKPLGNKVCAIVTDDVNESAFTNLIHLGADIVYVISHPELSNGNIDAFVSFLEQICIKKNPKIVLTSRTYIGRNVGSRIAYRLGSGVAQDCTDVSIDEKSSRVIATRPVYGGSAVAKFQFNQDDPQVIIIRAKAFEPLKPDNSRQGSIEKLDIEIDDSAIQLNIIETVKEESEGIRLEDASVIVAGGRGLGGPEPFEQLEELANIFEGAVGASRAVCDAGWMDHSFQIGLTGKQVAPDIYITVGISGASQHMAGCLGSRNIIAINNDSDANIFKDASYGVVGDWEKVLPSFTEAVRDLLKS